MKQCNACKTLIDDEDSFCRKCGGAEFTPVIVLKNENINQRRKKEKEVKHKKKRKIIPVLLSTILLFAIGGVVKIFFTPANLIMYNLETNDYVKASQIYEKFVSDDFEKSQEVYNRVREQAMDLAEQYKKEKISYEEAMGKFYGFEQAGIYGREVANMSWEVKDLYLARENYAAAEKAVEIGDYKKAIELYDEIIDIDLGNGRDPVTKKGQAVELYYNEIVNKVQDYMDTEEYDWALTVIEESLYMFSGDTKLISMQETCQTAIYNRNIQNYLNEASGYKERQDYIGALNCLDSYIEKYPEEMLLQQKRKKYKEEFEEYVLAQTMLYMENEEYPQALTYAENNKAYLTDTRIALMEELIHDIKSYIPVKLGDMEIFNNDTVGGQWMSYTDARDIYLEDNYGNLYEHSLSVEKGSLTYLVNYKYQTLKGTVACPKGKASDSFREWTTLTIYGDGYEIAKFSGFNETIAPQYFEIDVTPYERVTLSWECTGDNIWHNWGYFATIFDGVFIPIPC